MTRARGAWQPKPWMPLSARQWQIVELVGDGLSNEKIAQQLYVSAFTVKSHLCDIYTKTGAVSRANLIAIVAARQANRGARIADLVRQARTEQFTLRPDPRTAAWYRQEGALAVLEHLLEQIEGAQ